MDLDKPEWILIIRIRPDGSGWILMGLNEYCWVLMHPDGSGRILIGLDGLIDLNGPLRVWMDPDLSGWNLISLDGSR